MNRTEIKLLAVTICLACIATLSGCATSVNPVSGRLDRGLMSEQDEIDSGREIHQQVLKEYPPYKNPTLQAYVTGIGLKLAQHSHRANLPWTFTVVDSPEINAFAVQGGYIYITRGLMAYLDSEAELAGVLGHEIGHVTARHGARAARDQQIAAGTQLLGTLLGAYLGGDAGASLGGQITGGYAQAGFLLPRSREHELQADELGAEYMQRVGFDPDLMEKVIAVLKAQETFARDDARLAGRSSPDTPNWLRTHPSNDQRLEQMHRIANQYSGKYADAGRNRYLQTINGLTFGDSRESGVIRGQDFYHEPLGFTLRAPAKWTIQNSPSSLNLVADDLQAAVSLTPSPSRGDHAAAIRNLLKPDQGRTESTTINGLRATNFIGSRLGAEINATVITLSGNDYIFQKLQKAAARNAYDRELQDVVTSFRAMTTQDGANAKPYTIRTAPAPRVASPFAEMARDVRKIAPQYRNAEAQLRLLNQAYPQGKIAPGQLVKTIQ